jgi:CelD/BcsL family acetyltransferase involved in cellulose biosynthesis
LSFQVFEDWASLATLEGEWNRLLERSRADSIFLRWEWIETWRSVAGEKMRPYVVAVRDPSGALLGVAPLYRSGLKLLRLLPFGALRVLGDHHTGAEYSDFILPRDGEAEAAREIAEALARAPGGWDCLWLPNVAGWTGAYERIAGACAAAGLTCRARPRVFSAAELPKDFASYRKSLSGNARSMLQRQTRAAFGSPDVVFEECRAADEVPAYLEALFALNHRRWSAVGQVGTFVRKPMERRFYEAFAPRALERGWLRLFAIRERDRFLAVQIGYAYGSSFLQLQEGFDPEAPSGIGNVLRVRVIERCIEEGLTTYDFLGDHTEHKRRWSARARDGFDLLIWRRSLKNRLATSLPLWPTGRYLQAHGEPQDGLGASQ